MALSKSDRELLDRYRPCLQYDSQVLCRAASAATAAVSPSSQLVLRRKRRKQIAETASGAPLLSLDTLGRYFADGRAKGNDYLAASPNRLDDARTQQADDRYRDRIYGEIRHVDDAKRLWYWLWFYYDPQSLPDEAASEDGAWRTFEVELAADGSPTRALIGHKKQSWDKVRKQAGPHGEHPLLFVEPLAHTLLFDPDQPDWGSLSCDANGPQQLPSVDEPTAWRDWPGRWGPNATSPKSPPHESSPASIFLLLAERLRPLWRPRERARPKKPVVDAPRLEADRVVLPAVRCDETTTRVVVTVHRGNETLAARSITKPSRHKNYVVDLPARVDRCTLRVSALTGAPGVRRSDVETYELDARDRDPLEESIFATVLEGQLREKEVVDFLDGSVDDREKLSNRVEAKAGELWSRVASDLQAFRDARTARDRRQEAARQRRVARLLSVVCAALLLLILAGVVAIALLVDLLTAVLLPFGFWYVAVLPVWGLIAQVKRYRNAEAELARWPDPSGPAEDAPLKAARARFERALREKAIAPAIREGINERVNRDYGAKLDFADEGLTELRVHQQEVTTRARVDLKNLTGRMRGGSIGIAGPRGAGKTTLIEAFCERRDATDRRLTRVVAAPAKYDPRDFILALFADVCQAVLDSPRPGAHRPTPRPSFSQWRRWWPSIAALLLTAVGAAVIWRESRLVAGAFAMVGALVALGLGWKRRRSRTAGTPEPPEERLEHLARTHLDQIRFQQSFSYGFSGRLALPLGAEVGAQQSEDFTEQQATFPEIVARFRSFLEAVAATRGGVVIGIDEMDKMESSDSAKQFLNEIKGIFGVERCFFLVSISESAMSSFDRRGLPFRDVFDSSFDEVLAVEPLPLRQSKALLRTRVVGLGPAYLDLCHCLSGGLARDLLRNVRQLSLYGGKGLTIAGAAQALIGNELRRKVEAAVVEANKTAAEPPLSSLQLWLRGVGAMELSVQRLLKWSQTPPDSWPEGSSEDSQPLIELHLELATFALYLATVLELFTKADERPGILQLAEDGEEDERSALDALARARAEFAVNSRLARKMLTDFRAGEWWSTNMIEDEPLPELSDREPAVGSTPSQ